MQTTTQYYTGNTHVQRSTLLSIFSISFPLNNVVKQAASQWVLCFSGSLPNALYWFSCDCSCFWKINMMIWWWWLL